MFFEQDLKPDGHGLVAIGGRLHSDIILEAYSKGIFPWCKNPSILWFSPDPRMVLFPSEFHLSKSLARLAKRHPFDVELDTDFEAVIRACGGTRRRRESGTWIDEEFIESYTELHRLGFGHSVEVRENGRLVGGLYGLSIGGVFFGESMFSAEPNTSKLAFYMLTQKLREWDFDLIDCQVRTDHLASLGAREIPRQEFLSLLRASLQKPTRLGKWQFELSEDRKS